MADDLRITGLGGLVLEQRVDGLEEPGVRGRDRVERRPCPLHEGRGRHLRRCRERHEPLEERADAGPGPTRRVGVDLEGGLDRGHRRCGIAVHHERPAEHQRPVRAGVPDVEAAFRHDAVVAGGHEQELAARAAVRPREPEVDDPLEPHVVERAQGHRRRLDHHRPVGQVDEAEVVDGVAVRGQEQRRRIHQLREDQHRVVLHADAQETLADRLRRCSRERGQERVEAVHEVEMVVQRLDRLPGRSTIGELERAEPTVDLVRRRQRGQHLRRHFRHLISFSFTRIGHSQLSVTIRRRRWPAPGLSIDLRR